MEFGDFPLLRPVQGFHERVERDGVVEGEGVCGVQEIVG